MWISSWKSPVFNMNIFKWISLLLQVNFTFNFSREFHMWRFCLCTENQIDHFYTNKKFRGAWQHQCLEKSRHFIYGPLSPNDVTKTSLQKAMRTTKLSERMKLRKTLGKINRITLTQSGQTNQKSSASKGRLKEHAGTSPTISSRQG